MTNNKHIRYGWQSMIERRKEFRKNPTEAERVLWEKVSSKKLLGFKLRRQHGIGRFVVDFCHTKSRTVIEIDGSVHSESEVMENDKNRQRELEELGYTFLRFSNEEVLTDLDSVLERILRHLEPIKTEG